MDYADKLDLMDDDCDVQGFPICKDSVVTNGDRVRAMGDEELASWITDISACYQEKIACTGKPRKASGKCDGKCKSNRLDWLRQPYEEEHK